MLTGRQIRAARALLNWSQTILAARSEVSIASIRRIEPQDGVPKAHTRTLLQIEECFSSVGISFSAELGNVGVSLEVEANKGAGL